MASGAQAALRLSGIRKRFGAIVAVKDAALEVRVGAVHAIVGENGAGKSTLLKIGAGILAPDAGQIRVAGEEPPHYDARAAQALGIAMVQQHFALFGDLTVLENLILGAEPSRSAGRIDVAKARALATRALAGLGVTLALDAKVKELGVADKQRLEIVRALYREARVLILDEPTAILTPGEADALYVTLRRLATEGRAVVVVTHRLDEVAEHADVVTVMRRGETRGTRDVERGASVESLAAELVGGALPPEIAPAARELGEVRLDVRDLACGRALRGVSFDVRAGEIVGVAGVLGNGQSELVRVLGGLLAEDAGRVAAGSIEVVHEDRQSEGLVLDASVEDNLVLGELGSYTRRGVVDDDRVHATAVARIARFDVRPADPSLSARALSGGNQQKIVLGRALAREPHVLVVAHPTRGVDLLAARSIHEQLRAAAARGMALLVVSADLHELRQLADRILVMFRGQITATLPPTADDHAIGAAMLGGQTAASA